MWKRWLGWVMLLGLVLMGLWASPVQAQTATFPCTQQEAQAVFLQLQTQGHVTLMATEDRINGCLARYRAQWERQGIRDLRVDFQPDRMVLYVRRGWMRLAVHVRPYVQDGRLYAEITSVRWGFLPVPRSLWGDYETRMKQALERAYRTQPLLQALQVRNLVLDDNGFQLELAWRR